ncbi:MAG: DHA2 family efflux MFS transporter permease subunit [Novosphingobium sp.]|nr:DHA2 family efflux MFS transporter permease subunit [Novosphingobium sp.]
MAATIMNALDSTIANVALPHIQGSVSASQEEITWVLTSYIVSAAIFTPLTGWMAGRFGRKRLMLVSVVGFTIASGLCGLATSLTELVLFRVLQGVFGAALVPMSQAILLDINPPERHGPAMAIWGMGAVLGPIVGPALGGWLTDNLDWRWVFYINLPIGIVTFFGISAFLSETRDENPPRLDFLGFALLSLGIGSLQVMLDRGQQQDWFNSLEIWIEAIACGTFFYLFIVHLLTTSKQPFIDLRLFADRNFVLGTSFGFFLGVFLFSVLALLPPMLEGLLGYPVVLTGLVTAPRGLGSMVSMIVVGQLIKRFDVRVLTLIGLTFSALSMYLMSSFSLYMDSTLVMVSGFVQGLGTGLIFIPLSTLAFTTLDTKLRNDGAAMFTLIRNMGSAIGISVLQAMTIRNASTVHSRLVENLRPDNPLFQQAKPDFQWTSPAQVAALNAEVTRQAGMVSYIDAFWLLFVATCAIVPLILLMRPAKKAPTDDDLGLHIE